MAFGPLYASLPTDGSGNHYVDSTSWNQVITNFSGWQDNVNAGTYNLSNLGTLNFSSGGSITGSASGLVVSALQSVVTVNNPSSARVNYLQSKFTGSATSFATGVSFWLSTSAAFSSSVTILGLEAQIFHGLNAGGGSGNILVATALSVGVAVFNSATVTTGYGIYINAIAGAAAYGIYDNNSGNLWYAAGKLGLGTSSVPMGALDVGGVCNWRRGAITLSNGTNNNVGLSTTTYVVVTGPTSSYSITGFDGGYDGRLLILLNNTSQQLTILPSNAGSSSGNQILTLSGSSVVLRTGTSAATFVYDATASKWILVSFN